MFARSIGSWGGEGVEKRKEEEQERRVGSDNKVKRTVGLLEKRESGVLALRSFGSLR